MSILFTSMYIFIYLRKSVQMHYFYRKTDDGRNNIEMSTKKSTPQSFVTTKTVKYH